MGTPAAQTLSLPFSRAGVAGTVEVAMGVNDDPVALGCPEWARGFPWCRATVTPPARGYADMLGWVQLVDWDLMEGGEGFLTDLFAPLGEGVEREESTHPFCFFGYSPTLFDAPHSDVGPRHSEFVAHSFLCGLGPQPLAMRFEADAILGFSWEFRIDQGTITIGELAPLGPEAWDGHHEYLRGAHPRWTFLPGFAAE
jgi:hypothetical protein